MLMHGEDIAARREPSLDMRSLVVANWMGDSRVTDVAELLNAMGGTLMYESE